MNRRSGNRIILGVLLFFFITYNIVLYTGNTSKSNASLMSKEALKGEMIWQQNNCTSCHQLYGLGGYLAPDLTNIISNKEKGKAYAKAFFNSGVKSMPKFDFTEEEKNNLISFLEHVDKTGYYPNKNAEFEYDGWVSIEYK
jgi:nitric oxide reductase subunit C